MVVIARSIVNRPRVIMIDEMSSGLAPVIVSRLMKAVRQLADNGMAVVLVEQFAALALAIGNRAYVLRRGRMVYDGGCEALARDPAIPMPAPGSSGDPRCGGDASGTVKASLSFSSLASSAAHSADLPCQHWQLIGSESAPKGYKYKDKSLASGTAKIVVWKGGSMFKAALQGKGAPTHDDCIAFWGPDSHECAAMR